MTTTLYVRDFAHYEEARITAYRVGAVKWALSRESEHNQALKTMQTDAAIFSVALGIDGDVDEVLVDENNDPSSALEDLDRAAAAITRAREHLARMFSAN